MGIDFMIWVYYFVVFVFVVNVGLFLDSSWF